MFKLTGRPTISSVSFFSLHSLVFTVSILRPFLRIVTRSLMESTSWSLCVIIMMAQPCSFILRRMANNLSVSCGVRTAVGSSRIRIWAPLYNTFKISTVCFSLTDISKIFFSGSISSPKDRLICSIFSFKAFLPSRFPPVPNTMLSIALNTSTSLKC